jgi:hypothetical protein
VRQDRSRSDKPGRRGEGGAGDGPPYDIVTPTDRERLERRLARRRRRYLAVMVPCLVLVAFGFFVPAPTPLRLVALAFAAWMPPVAAIVGNADGPQKRREDRPDSR